jgi:membrane-bound serine protease (ClpP class)
VNPLIVDPASVDPNVIYLTLIFSLWIGVTAAYIPGTGLIEVLALAGLAISFVLLRQLPTNWLAALVVVVGVSSFFVMPFIKQRYAALAVGGLALQGIGGLLLFDGLIVSPFAVALTLAIPLAYHQWALMPVLRNMSQQPIQDRDDSIIGMQGRVVREINPLGTVHVDSELWSASSDEHLQPGDPIIVVERRGLQLVVERFKRKREENNHSKKEEVS